MLTFDHHGKRFNHRVAGACTRDAHVLLTHAEGEDFWLLPGGRAEFLEDTRTALHREIREELGCEADIGRLLWVVEDFFTLSGRLYHEVAFVYDFQPTDPSILETTWTRNFADGGTKIEFRWFPLKDLHTVNLQPAFLKEVLNNPPQNTTHLIVRE
jgi:8-oxo-dGTP pyrophosphatase MutT (NUDIX family)